MNTLRRYFTLKSSFKIAAVVAVGLALIGTLSAAAAYVNWHVPASQTSKDTTTTTPIKHLVVIFQENVSFDQWN
jgi:phospholipase C